MTCLSCQHFRIKSEEQKEKPDERMGRAGYGLCKQRESGRYVAYTKPACEQYEAALDMVIEKRVAWMKGSK